jgi:sulfonate transport system permease protein
MARALGETLATPRRASSSATSRPSRSPALALVWPRSRAVVTGLALLVFCLPLVATGPILRVIFGPGDGPQIALAALAVYYTTLIPLLVGLRAAPDSWFDLCAATAAAASPRSSMSAMAALPYLFAGLQIAAPAAFLGAMVGEFTGAERGMGVLTIRAMRALDVEMTWALATVATAVSVARLSRHRLAGAADAARRAAGDPRRRPARPRRGRRRAARVGGARRGRGAGALVGADRGLRPQPVLRQGAGRRLRTPSSLAPDAPARRARRWGRTRRDRRLPPAGLPRRARRGRGARRSPRARARVASTAMPLAIALRSVPIVTTAPLVVLLLGRGATGTIALVAVMVFFPTFVACLHGLRQAPGQVMDVFDSYAAGPRPAPPARAHPGHAARLLRRRADGVPASVLAVTVVEWLATGNGIGSLMAISASLSDYDMLWSAVVLVAVLSALGYAGVGLIEARILRVYAPEQLAVSLRPAAFAIPGDITTLTGGYIYERRLLEGLRALGHDVQHIALGAVLPRPTARRHGRRRRGARRPAAGPRADPRRAGLRLHRHRRPRPRPRAGRRDDPPPARARKRARRPPRHLYRTERDNLARRPCPRARARIPPTSSPRDYGVDPARITIARPGTDRPLRRRPRPRTPAADPVGRHPAPAQGARHPAARARALTRPRLAGGDRRARDTTRATRPSRPPARGARPRGACGWRAA